MARTTKRSPPPIASKAYDLGVLKLESSGLTADDGKLLKVGYLDGNATHQLHPAFKALCSLQLNYLDLDGEPLPDWPGAPPFYRVRYLETDTSFAGVTDKKPPRYVQLPNSAPVAYFPGNQDWGPIAEDTDLPLIITEGELKAAKACKEGFPTIGLGGVHNWRSHRLGLTWLPSLEPIDWVKRNTYICFDSDYQTNPNVCSALCELAEELHRRGAFVHMVSLPQLENLPKVGLDDYLIHAGPTANDMFRGLLTNAEPLGLTKPLWSLNAKYVYVRNPGLIIDQESAQKITPSAFTQHLEATNNYQERRLKADGTISYVTTSASTAWLKWPLRQEVNNLTYKPGSPKFISDPHPVLNTWPGWGIQPEAGDVEPFITLVDHIFERAEPEAKLWFLRWCAYPLQYPGLSSSAASSSMASGMGLANRCWATRSVASTARTSQKLAKPIFTTASMSGQKPSSSSWAMM